jgi:hypothetical protein
VFRRIILLLSSGFNDRGVEGNNRRQFSQMFSAVNKKFSFQFILPRSVVKWDVHSEIENKYVADYLCHISCAVTKRVSGDSSKKPAYETTTILQSSWLITEV